MPARSETCYKGSNAIRLEIQGRGSPRWLTYKQAQGIDARARKGAKGTLVQYWQFTNQVTLKDEREKALLDQDGNRRFRTVESANLPQPLHPGSRFFEPISSRSSSRTLGWSGWCWWATGGCSPRRRSRP